jgi:SM-20-related protein
MLLDLAGRVSLFALTSMWRSAARLRGPLSGLRSLPVSAREALIRDGFAVVPGWLPPEDAASVLQDATALEDSGLTRAAGVGGVIGSESTGWSVSPAIASRVDGEIRRTSSVWIHLPFEPLQGVLSHRLSLLSSVEALRAQLSCDDMWALHGDATSLAYLYYPAGGFYGRHVDAPRKLSPTGENREVSFLLYLGTAGMTRP